MPDRKPPQHQISRPDATLPSSGDTPEFSIESTTMRLKSMSLRRAEREQQEAAAVGSKPKKDSDLPRHDGPSGRVRHDDRGQAVWDWAVATGEFSTLSTTRALKKLEVEDLKIEDTLRPSAIKLEVAGRDKGGGFDPYNQRGSGKREGEASKRQGVTGSSTRDRPNVLDQLTGKKK